MKQGMLILLLLTVFKTFAVDPTQYNPSDSLNSVIDSLRAAMGNNKSYPAYAETPFLLALGHYDGFENTKIKVVERNIKTTMECRPTLGSILRKPEKRTYKIYIDKDKIEHEGIVYEELPFGAQIGVFGHELAHILDYNSKSGAQIVAMGIQYLIPEKRREIEHSIDLLAIEHGLGYQINDFAVFVFEESQASEEYKEYKRKYYFQPIQIRNILSGIPQYRFKKMLAGE